MVVQHRAHVLSLSKHKDNKIRCKFMFDSCTPPIKLLTCGVSLNDLYFFLTETKGNFICKKVG